MGAFTVNDTSEIHIDEQYLTIRISRRACAAWVWAQITRLVQIANERADDATTGDGTAHVSLARPWRHRALDIIGNKNIMMTKPRRSYSRRMPSCSRMRMSKIA